MADSAIDIGDRAARPAHDMVMVVCDPGFESSGRACRLDAPNQARACECAEHVVDGLRRHLAQIRTDHGDDRVGVGVRMRVHGAQNSDPRACHPQVSRAQDLREIRGLRHPRSLSSILE